MVYLASLIYLVCLIDRIGNPTRETIDQTNHTNKTDEP